MQIPELILSRRDLSFQYYLLLLSCFSAEKFNVVVIANCGATC
jgi:hypothetical protein